VSRPSLRRTSVLVNSLVGALAILSSGAAIGAPPDALKGLSCTHFRWISGEGHAKAAIAVPVALNGHKYWFRLDTGSNATLVYGDTAQKLGWAKKGDTPFIAQSLALGGMRLSEVPIYIQPAMPAGSGTIGIDVMLNRDAIIDYPGQRFCMVQPTKLPQAIRDKASWSLAALRNGKYFVSVKIGDKDLPDRFFFDTGSSLFALSVEKAKWEELTDFGKVPVDPIKGTSWGKAMTWAGAIAQQRISVGGIALQRPAVFYEDNGFYKDNYNAMGLVGNAPFMDKMVILGLAPFMTFGVLSRARQDRRGSIGTRRLRHPSMITFEPILVSP
jgi:predicted aspartyl protease